MVLVLVLLSVLAACLVAVAAVVWTKAVWVSRGHVIVVGQRVLDEGFNWLPFMGGTIERFAFLAALQTGSMTELPKHVPYWELKYPVEMEHGCASVAVTMRLADASRVVSRLSANAMDQMVGRALGDYVQKHVRASIFRTIAMQPDVHIDDSVSIVINGYRIIGFTIINYEAFASTPTESPRDEPHLRAPRDEASPVGRRPMGTRGAVRRDS